MSLFFTFLLLCKWHIDLFIWNKIKTHCWSIYKFHNKQ